MSEDAIRALIVEDNPADARLIAEYLKDTDGPPVRITEAPTLEAGLEAVGSSDFDVVLLDLNLPGSIGLESLYEISRANDLVPIVVLTGIADREVGIAALQSGAQDYLVKDHTDGYSLDRAIRYAIERKRAQTALRRSEERFRTLVEISPAAIYLTDEHGKCLYINPKWIEISGLAFDEAEGDGWVKAIHPEDRNTVFTQWNDMVLSGASWTEGREFRFRDRRGKTTWVYGMATPTIDPSGRRTGYIGVNVDITARKTAEEQLERFRRAVESSADAVGMSTPQGEHFYHNEAFEKLFGDVGEDPRASVYVKEEVGREVFRTIMDGGKWSGEVKMRGKGGEILDVLLRAYPITDDNGNITGLIGLHTDITDLKRGEERIRHLNAVLRAVRDINQLITKRTDRQSLLEGICRVFVEGRGYHSAWLALVDARGRLTTTIHSGPDTLEETMESMLAGKTLPRCARTALEGPGVFLTEDPASSCGDCPIAGSYSGHSGMTVRIEYDEKVYGVLSVSAPSEFVTEQEEQSILLEAANDIAFALHSIETDEKSREVEEQLIQAQKMEAIGQLAGGVAHDLNNLLSPILGYGEILLERLEVDDPNSGPLREMYKAALRARGLVRQLLSFSRKQTLDFKSVDLNRVVADFDKLLRRTIRENIELKVDLMDDAPPISADVGQLEQIIMNLAVNAQDAMPDGGELLLETDVIELDERYAEGHRGVIPGRYVMLAVSDTGVGMEQDKIEKAFEPFYTTKLDEGTGLGLSVAYGIVKQHGGNIWIYSEPGRGTTCKVYFPVSDQVELEDEEKSSSLTELKGSESVLLVEDNEQVRNLAREVLEFQGYDVIPAESGKQALSILEGLEEPADLLLTDVVMPDMNGKKLYDTASKRWPGLRVLYMSGYTENVIARQGIVEDGTLFIQKPFTIRDLASKVREVLDGED
ncbi:response regulator [Candidatus Fermentibacteria bacterium]|nr:response regulator [Candidatus Fermentibacteria bacterium]